MRKENILISLMNIDSKILTKILENEISKYVSKCFRTRDRAYAVNIKFNI